MLEPPAIAVVPFVLLLLAIALMPLLAPRFWEHNRNKAVVAGLLAAPIAVWLAGVSPLALVHSAREYVSFIALLGSLFVVAGGIHLDGDLRATPGQNTLLLALGGLLANVLGTTGASMLLISGDSSRFIARAQPPPPSLGGSPAPSIGAARRYHSPCAWQCRGRGRMSPLAVCTPRPQFS